jgi:hypothetical protein
MVTSENGAFRSMVTSLSSNSGEYRTQPSIYIKRICDSGGGSVKNSGCCCFLLRLRASPAVSPTRPPTAVFYIRTTLFFPAAPPAPRLPPRIWSFVCPESPGHPQPPGCARGLWTREKWGRARSIGERTHEPHRFVVAHPPPLPLLCRRRHHTSPIRLPVASTPSFLHPTAYILPLVLPSAYFSPSKSSLASRLIDTPDRCSSNCLAGHGLRRGGGADVRRAF